MVEDVAGELSVGYVADVQTQQVVVPGRTGQGKRTPASIAQQDVDVLAGEVLKPLAFGKPELENHDVMGGHCLLDHAAGRITSLYVAIRYAGSGKDSRELDRAVAAFRP